MARLSITGSVHQSLGEGRYRVSAAAAAPVEAGTLSTIVDTISSLAGSVTGMATAIADLRSSIAGIAPGSYELNYDTSALTNVNQVKAIMQEVLRAARASGRFAE